MQGKAVPWDAGKSRIPGCTERQYPGLQGSVVLRDAGKSRIPGCRKMLYLKMREDSVFAMKGEIAWQ
jgi:hypothetical protein